MSSSFRIEGLSELEFAIRRIGNLPQKIVTKSSRIAANIVLRAARELAPKEKGDLKKAMYLYGERPKYKGQKVFQITFRSKMNNVLVKTSRAGKRSYYPASQEYGFETRNGGYVEGRRFMRDAAERNKTEVENTIIKELTTRIDGIWKGGKA